MGTCDHHIPPREAWRKREDGLEESVQFTPGYNCPLRGGSSHGVHGMEIRWLLRGPAGGAQFLIYTDWIPGKRAPGHGLAPDGSYTWQDSHGEPYYPMGADVGYHARRPQFEGQTSFASECSVIGGVCYYDGSSLRAARLAQRFVVEGEPAVWAVLLDVYGELAAEELAARQAESGL